MADVLTLGGFTFDGYSTPTSMGAGGKQAMIVHKLPGGARVIDTLGPDEDSISWSGFFWGDNSLSNMVSLDAMRAAGQVISLTFAGQFRSVIISDFSWRVRRLPVWGEYNISCIVYQNPSFGLIGATQSSVDVLILSDLAAALQ